MGDWDQDKESYTMGEIETDGHSWRVLPRCAILAAILGGIPNLEYRLHRLAYSYERE